MPNELLETGKEETLSEGFLLFSFMQLSAHQPKTTNSETFQCSVNTLTGK